MLNTEALIKAVEHGVSTVPVPPPPPADLPLWVARFALRIPSPELVEPIVTILRREPDLAIFDNHLQQIGNQARRVTFAELAGWLVSRARQVGPEAAVLDLNRYITESSFRVVETCLLTGITVSEATEITSNISLVSFEQLPDSPHKQMFTPTFGNAFAMARNHATAALICSGIHPRHHTVGGVPMLSIPSAMGEMNDIRRVLTLIGPCAPVVAAFWVGTDQSVPLGDTATGWSHPVEEEGGIRTPAALAAADLGRLRELYGLLRAASAGHQQHLRVPLERLNRALRRINKTDSAIELGIALEALLLNDLDDERGELTLRLRLRGARLVGQTTDARTRIYRLLEKVYRLRSRAVHSGVVPEDLEGMPTSEILQQGYVFTAQAIETIIRLGRNPDWVQITLG